MCLCTLFSNTYTHAHTHSFFLNTRYRVSGVVFVSILSVPATTPGGSAASFAALLSSRISDVSETASMGHMSNSQSHSSDVVLLGAGARISSVTGRVNASNDASPSVRDDATARAYSLTAAALYRDFYGSELTMLSDDGEKTKRGAVPDDDECTSGLVEHGDRVLHAETIEESVI